MKNIILATTIVLCLGLVGCTETTNTPIYGEPIVINYNPVGEIIVDHIGFNISDVLIKSDLIVVTNVYKVVSKIYEIDHPDNLFSAHLQVTKVLKESTNAKEIQVNADRFSKNDKYILFLRKEGDSCVLTTEEVDFSNASVICFDIPYIDESFYYKDDIRLLLDAYNKNKDLFSKAGKQDLFNLWTQLKSDHVIKGRFLLDVYHLVDEQDIPMLLKWKQRETNMHVINQIEGIIQMLQGRGE
jgi:hypothetical protein